MDLKLVNSSSILHRSTTHRLFSSTRRIVRTTFSCSTFYFNREDSTRSSILIRTGTTRKNQGERRKKENTSAEILQAVVEKMTRKSFTEDARASAWVVSIDTAIKIRNNNFFAETRTYQMINRSTVIVNICWEQKFFGGSNKYNILEQFLFPWLCKNVCTKYILRLNNRTATVSIPMTFR